MRGKTDWIVRGLPTEPPASIRERVAVLRYFVNNLAPGFRSAWIRLSRRITAADFARDDLDRIAPDSLAIGPRASAPGRSVAVVLNRDGVFLGVIEGDGAEAGRDSAQSRAIDLMDPAPQTIRPDMTLRLAAALSHPGEPLLITDAHGRYVGRYQPSETRTVG